MNALKTQLVLSDLLPRAATLRTEQGWEPFHPGIGIQWLYQTAGEGPQAALLRYQAGGRAPLHEHLGYEHVLVLDGAQSDSLGCYPAGSLTINPPGSCHAVFSENGCVALLIWERLVRFL